MATIEKTQRTFWINPSIWVEFQKDSLDLGKSSSERIEEFVTKEVQFFKNKKSKKRG